jgi:hypothetical protein
MTSIYSRQWGFPLSPSSDRLDHIWLRYDYFVKCTPTYWTLLYVDKSRVNRVSDTFRAVYNINEVAEGFEAKWKLQRSRERRAGK